MSEQPVSRKLTQDEVGTFLAMIKATAQADVQAFEVLAAGTDNLSAVAQAGVLVQDWCLGELERLGANAGLQGLVAQCQATLQLVSAVARLRGVDDPMKALEELMRWNALRTDDDEESSQP